MADKVLRSRNDLFTVRKVVWFSTSGAPAKFEHAFHLPSETERVL